VVLGREVAVKELTMTALLPEERSALYDRLLPAARSAARLRHPGIATVFDVLEQDGRPWVVMELLSGRSLADVLAAEGTLLPRDAARLAQPLLDALANAHMLGVLHRDVKPANVRLEPAGRVVLTDFGLAVFEGPSDVARIAEALGSADYLAPEVAAGRRPSPESDLWSLGATLYAAVEGQPPFHRATTASTLQAAVTEPLPPPSRAGPLAAVIEALLDKAPDQRPDAGRTRLMLDRVLTGPAGAAVTPAVPPPPSAVPGPVPPPSAEPAHPTGPPPAARRRKPRIRTLIAAVSLLVALIVGGLAVAKLTSGTHHVARPAQVTAPATPPAGGGTGTAPTPSQPSTGPASPSATDPRQVVQNYYAAINAHDYASAWALGGKNLGSSYSAFVSGFASTASDTVTVLSVSGNTVAVHIDATQTDGSHRQFAGTYTVQNGEIVSAALHAI
jgi:hypothetical protein